jgi:Zn-dependent protease with chaperone function
MGVVLALVTFAFTGIVFGVARWREKRA